MSAHGPSARDSEAVLIGLKRSLNRWLTVLAQSAVVALGYVAACNAALVWEITTARLAASGPTVTLRSSEKIVATLPTSQLQRLHDVKERVGAAAGMPYVALGVTDQDEPNAFAGEKDGRRLIAFTLGMLRLLGEDEGMMAAVMGHEFGHHMKGHDGRGTRTAAVEVVGLLAGIIAGRTIADRLAADLTARAVDLVGRAVIHSYDRDQEREADSFGVEVMARAGYDPYGAVRYWNLVANQASGGLFTTHPATAERLQNVQELARLHGRTVTRTSNPTPSATSPSVIAVSPASTSAPGAPPALAVAAVARPAPPPTMRTPDTKQIENIFGCLAPGLPHDWAKVWVVVTELGGPPDKERKYEAKFYFATAATGDKGEPLTPCNAQEIARQVYGMNDLLAPDKRNWRQAQLLITSEGRFNLRYDYAQ